MTTVTVCRTYEVISEESAELGDVEEAGFSMDPEPYRFRDALEEITRKGWQHADTSYSGFYAVHYSDTDYRTGDERTETTHVQCSPAAARRALSCLAAIEHRNRTRR